MLVNRRSVLVVHTFLCLSIANINQDPSKPIFKVVRAFPNNEKEVNLLHSLYSNSTELALDFWKSPTIEGAFSDIMAEASVIKNLTKIFDNIGLSHSITIHDVHRLTVQREGKKKALDEEVTNPLLLSFFKRMNDFTSRNRAKYGFGDYHSYDEMVKWMKNIEYHYPSMTKTFNLGKTHEGRDIIGIKIGNPIHRTDKRIIWFDGGIHAREWAAVHTALYFIDQLISEYGVDPKITAYVDTLNFYITPVLNPDGFEYSQSDDAPQTRFWRKNRGPLSCFKDHWRRERCCSGVDLNRNFDFHWGETGSSSDVCSEIYQGKAAFSEPESRAVRDKILSSELYGKVDAFITLHTYSQMWIHPFNHQKRSVPPDINDLEYVGKQGVKALEEVYGTKYRFGTGADILYPSAGGSDDWAKAKGNVKYVYLLELRPGEDEWDGFLLDKRQLIPTGRETWAGVRAVIDAVMLKTQSGVRTSTAISKSATKTDFSTRDLLNRHSPLGQPQRLRSKMVLRRSRQKSGLYRFLKYRRQGTNERRQRSKIVCEDRSLWCKSWIQSSPGICKNSYAYMSQYCARTCNFCDLRQSKR